MKIFLKNEGFTPKINSLYRPYVRNMNHNYETFMNNYGPNVIINKLKYKINLKILNLIYHYVFLIYYMNYNIHISYISYNYCPLYIFYILPHLHKMLRKDGLLIIRIRFIDSKIGTRVVCGCFTGTVEEFSKNIEKTHKNNQEYLEQYRLFCQLIGFNFKKDD